MISTLLSLKISLSMQNEMKILLDDEVEDENEDEQLLLIHTQFILTLTDELVYLPALFRTEIM